jgi:hypothetical protein
VTTTNADVAAVVTAASIVNPQGEPFTGTFDEAVTAMVRWAETERDADPVVWRGRVAKRLAASDPDRVAEVCAGALLLIDELRADVERYERRVDCGYCGGDGCNRCSADVEADRW